MKGFFVGNDSEYAVLSKGRINWAYIILKYIYYVGNVLELALLAGGCIYFKFVSPNPDIEQGFYNWFFFVIFLLFAWVVSAGSVKSTVSFAKKCTAKLTAETETYRANPINPGTFIKNSKKAVKLRIDPNNPYVYFDPGRSILMTIFQYIIGLSLIALALHMLFFYVYVPGSSDFP